MPTYEYQCEQCEHEFEMFQQITAPPHQQCPECRGHVRRLIGGGSGFIFKGSGFYATDYRSQKYRDAAKADQKPTDTPASSDSSGSEKSSSKPSTPTPSTNESSTTKKDVAP